MRAAVALGVLLACSGCGRQPEPLPIDQAELPGVLLDVYLAETEANLRGTNLQEARIEALRIRGYDTTDLSESIRILTEHPDLGKDIFQAVLDSAIFEQREIRSRTMADSAQTTGNR